MQVSEKMEALDSILERVEACETILEGTRPATIDDMRLVLQELVGLVGAVARAALQPSPDGMGAE